MKQAVYDWSNQNSDYGDTVGPGYFAPMRVDEFVASRILEAVVHGIDLTQALGREIIASTDGLKITASILDELLERRTVGRRPPELSDDLDWILAASGRAAVRRQPPPAHRLAAGPEVTRSE